MNRDEAAMLARTLMNEHGLHDVPFEFDRAKKRLGATHYQRPAGEIDYNLQKITLSGYWVQVLEEAEVRDVILHEIAHALTPHDAPSHGALWKRTARSIGASPVRCASPSDEVKARMHEIVPPAFIGRCPKAGHESTRYRRPKSRSSCGKCSRRFDPNNVIVWTPNR